jgi:hypothetical protein
MRFQSIRYLLNLLVEYNVDQTIGVAERGGGRQHYPKLAILIVIGNNGFSSAPQVDRI